MFAVSFLRVPSHDGFLTQVMAFQLLLGSKDFHPLDNIHAERAKDKGKRPGGYFPVYLVCRAPPDRTYGGN